MHVLIVDDDSEDREIVQDLLSGALGRPVTFTGVATYEEGLEAIARTEVDVCLLDYRLGARTGIEFLREAVVGDRHVPVILLTGEGSHSIDQEALEAGAVDYLSKRDLSAAALGRAVRYAVERARRMRLEGRFGALQAVSREALAIVAPSGEVRYVSPSVARILGYRPEDIAGKNIFEVAADGAHGQVIAELRRVAEDPDRTGRALDRVPDAGGSQRVLDVWAQNHVATPGVGGIVVAAWDVTDTVTMEERMRLQANLLEAVEQSIIAADLTGRVTYWNSASEALFGRSAPDAIGRPLEEVVSAEVAREDVEETVAGLLLGKPWSGEVRVLRPDGSSVPALVTASPILAADGSTQGLIGVTTDISQLKRTELQLRERVKELDLLFRAGTLLNDSSMPPAERLERLVRLIPDGWLHPEVTEARITLGRDTFGTPGFRDSPWRLSADIDFGEEEPGQLVVVLTEERPGEDVGPFLAEEVELVRTLAHKVGQAWERERLADLHARTVASLHEAVIVVESQEGGRVIQDVNPAAEHMFGYDRSELLGKTTETLHSSPESFRRFAEEGVPQLEATGTFRAEYPMRRRDGTVFEAEQTVSLLNPDEGLDGGVVSVVRDISATRRAEEELRTAEQRFGVLSQEITDVIYVVSENGTVLDSTASVEAVTGYPVGEFVGMNALDLVHPTDRAKVERLLQATLKGEGEAVRESYRILTRDAEVRHIESVSRDLLDHPAIGGIVVTSRDVTERTQFEERLRVTQRMEAIGKLAGGIAHDFNNILTIIRSQIDLTLLDVKDGALRQELELVRGAADRAAALTAQLLAFSRDQVLRPQLVDLGELAMGMKDLLDRTLGETIRVSYELEDGTNPVRVDVAQVEQVLLNLAVNAKDAMHEGGRLTIRVMGETLDSPEVDSLPGLIPGTYAKLSVSDTGHGITPDVLGRVFEPFFTTKERGKGTGLGLSMAYGVMKQSGGGIHAESTPGEGTTFHLRFPAEEGAPEPPRREAQAHPLADNRMTGDVLLVEDDPAVRRITKRILERLGFSVHAAEDAERAVEILSGTERVDLVLTDLVLPGMSGRGLIDWLERESPNMPIVVVSGYDQQSPGHRESLPDRVAFLQKPFTPEALARTLVEALHGE